jgi:hypothetical protein
MKTLTTITAQQFLIIVCVASAIGITLTMFGALSPNLTLGKTVPKSERHSVLSKVLVVLGVVTLLFSAGTFAYGLFNAATNYETTYDIEIFAIDSISKQYGDITTKIRFDDDKGVYTTHAEIETVDNDDLRLHTIEVNNEQKISPLISNVYIVQDYKVYKAYLTDKENNIISGKKVIYER